jgi:hypothetical protein
MAAPNLLALTTVQVDTAHANATTSAADLIAAITTGHARKIESIIATNIHATVIGEITVWHRKGGTDHMIANATRVPLRSSVNLLLGSPLYLAEGDSLKIQASANSNIHVTAPYADMT